MLSLLLLLLLLLLLGTAPNPLSLLNPADAALAPTAGENTCRKKHVKNGVYMQHTRRL
jgi:hypothetical protein